MDLFTHAMNDRMRSKAPLAARMRPRTLDEYIHRSRATQLSRAHRRARASGDEYIALRRAIEADRLFSSILLWGQPGTGKTTLVQVITNTSKSHFETLSSVMAGKADLREVIERAQERRKL